MTDSKSIDIYTDGACKGNPGPGGWAAILFDSSGKRVLSGNEKRTTNNRMELLAAINGLDSTPQGSSVTVHSDSQYLVKTMTRNWNRNVNSHLWDRLDELCSSRKVRWDWVKAHDGDSGNEEADAWASWEARLREGPPPTNGGGIEGQPATLTHVDEEGRATMVDVGGKPDTQREAVARCFVAMQPETLRLIKNGLVKKGDVLATARLAGIMGAKLTPQLIPLCHPIPLNQVAVGLDLDEAHGGIHVTGTAKAEAKTGVEMEALTAVSVAALTIYDMCKSVDRGIRIQDIRLLRKQGGKSGEIVLEE